MHSVHLRESASADRVHGLSRRQLESLRLVGQHMSSKEIAAQLGISPHTVDQRIRTSLKVLGVARRSQAARLVARCGTAGPIELPPRTDNQRDPGGMHQGQLLRWSWQPPLATEGHPRNEMGAVQRLTWIAVIAAGVAFSTVIYLAGLESLGRLLAQ